METTKISEQSASAVQDKGGSIVLKHVFKDMLKYTPSKLVGIIGNILIVPIYTNLLTPEQYGLYSIAIATLSFLCIIFFDWIGTSGLRFFKIHQMVGDVSRYFSSLVTLLGINYLLMWGATLLFKNQITDFFNIPVSYLYFIGALILPVAFRSLLFQILRAQIKPTLYTTYTITNQFLTIAMAVAIIKFFNLGAFSILLAMALAIIIIDIAMIITVKLFSGFRFEKLQFGIIKHFCWYGMPLAVASLSMWIMNQSNKFIMQHYKGSFYNGIIGVSYNMTYSIFLTMFALIMIAAMPRIITMYEQKKNPQKLVSTLSGYFMGLIMPFVVFITIYTPEYVQALANPKFQQAVVLVPFLIISTFFVGLSDYTTIQYHLTKKTYINTIIKLIPGLLGVVLNILFIPKYGLLAVGWTTLLTNVLYFALSLVVVADKDLTWKFPAKESLASLMSLVPSLGTVFLMKSYFSITPLTQMLLAILIYYIVFIYSIKFVATRKGNI